METIVVNDRQREVQSQTLNCDLLVCVHARRRGKPHALEVET
jgi:hypothetical protein